VTRPDWFDPAMKRLFAREDLDAATMTAAVRSLVDGGVDESFAAAFLTSLRVKGESAGEIAAAVRVMRERMATVNPGPGPVVDTCGTGGDDAGTFNISTAAAFVVAACGVRVVKHGNRAVSSKSGSADVLRELGVPVERGVAWSQACLDKAGFAFCFAPHFHAGMANVGPLRRKLGVRTIFNLLGPLANPAGAGHQLIGVGKPELLDVLAGAVAELGTTRTVLVHGSDGLDEVTLSGPTAVRIVEGGRVERREWTPEEFGLERATVSLILAADAAGSAETIRAVLDNTDGPARRYVVANAAAALFAAGVAGGLKDGVAMAAEAIESGRAKGVAARLADTH
jgi:anthranilate phosphoribosyltransferase